MYRTCIYCHANLGENTVVEAFPVGRRLAYDTERGRLWVVCGACARWNLSPLETRWEAVEECERLFSTMRRRVATESVALAWSPEGLQLVRIGGDAPAGELAAWRYGRALLRRRIRVVPVAMGVAGAAGLAASAFAGGLVAGLYVTSYAALTIQALVFPDPSRILAMVRLSEGRSMALTVGDLKGLTLTHTPSAPYAVRLPRFGGRGSRRVLSRADSERLVRAALPFVNRHGGSARSIETAVSLLERAGDPDRYLGRLAQQQAGIARMSGESRLAFEMALHEQSEREALRGELGGLEAAWREAEEVAKIADTLGLPSWLVNRFSHRDTEAQR